MTTATMSKINELPSQYDHTAAQEKWYPFWEDQGYFHADPKSKKPPFTIVIPPPNVTGALHLGHALNNTLQDILCRMKRMQGFNVLWMPGTDHAGIATQAVVEKRLREEQNLTRHDLGREGLVDRIWQWKQQYEKRILGQLKQLGASCDWQRTRFTLDEQCARAVRETFFKLFKDGNIYRGKRLVNWDTFLQTAVSDDEVFHEVKQGHFWHFSYPVIDAHEDEPTHVTIATTRPETMLGDTAVAVHPNPAKALDKIEAELREKLASAPVKETPAIQSQLDALAERRETVLPGLIKLCDMAQRGVMLELPLTGRQIPLITDIWAKPELGSGCVKITPAHDANDYDVWQRNPSIGAINILHTDGTLNDNVPEKYRGLTMKKAREAVVADIETAELLVEIEDREIDLAHSDRSKTPIEPFLADQWFVKMEELAQSAMDAVTDGRVKITPDRYAKGYLDWLSEKRDWPIGRQLWWGHRIPVWEALASTRSGNESKTVTLVQQDQEQAKQELTTFLDAAGISADEYYVDDQVEPHPWKLRICASSETAASALNALAEFLRERREFQTALWNNERPESDLAEYQAMQVPGFEAASEHAREIKRLRLEPQDEEVLDTWFSSALWPHSTLGWPEQTNELKAFYPTSTLITSRDIITLWVARMVLMGEYNMGPVLGRENAAPFDQVYIHPKILDGYGETMSKSKGNGVDPLDVIEQFGADALRFGLAYLTTETQDVRMPVEFVCPHCNEAFKQTKKNRVLPRVACDKCGKEFHTQWAQSEEDLALPRGNVTSERFELGRNFCNKLWNASRFALMNLEGHQPAALATESLLIEDRWLLSRLASVTREVTAALAEFRYADAARELYSFAWDDFCSFYVEITKARFAVPEQRAVAQGVLAHALDVLLRLLHPMIPFLTEEVWQLLGDVAPERGLSPSAAAESVCIAAWPEADASHIDTDIERQFAQFQAVISAVRNIRTENNIPPKESVNFSVRCDASTKKLLEPMSAYFTSMARATVAAMGPDVTPPERVASKPLEGMEVHLDISDFFDVEAEKKRLASEQDKLAKYVKSINGKLSNENFVSRAPAEVVQAERDKLAEVEEQLAAVEAALAKL